MADKPDIVITKVSDVHAKIECEKSVFMELSDYMTFMSPNAKFDKRYRRRQWDGKIRLLNGKNKKIAVGLVPRLASFAKKQGYVVSVDPTIATIVGAVTPEKIHQLVVSQNISRKEDDGTIIPLDMYAYQYSGVYYAAKERRCLLVSPTASGKSAMIYSIARMLMQVTKKRTLILVSTTSLVEQIFSDFVDYSGINGWDTQKHCQKIYSLFDKSVSKDIVISTWQSIYEFDESYFRQFDSIIVDEVHLAEADSICGIMEKLKKCPYRIGLTGTLKDAKVHQLVLEGMFGAVHTLEKTKSLMDKGIITKLKINMVELHHKQADCEIVKKLNYQKEMEFISQHEKRNIFIKNLALKQKNNCLVLFQYIEKHGELLRSLLERDSPENRPVYYVVGETAVIEREKVRALCEANDGCIILASYGTFSTGINVKNIHSIVFASPYKSKIKVLQSIGRGLRKFSGKDELVLFDIVDDFGGDNYAVSHANARIEIYDKEEFDYEIFKIKF
ncbi:MAG: hypothetical protein BV459_00295 [Thermoplasmata archaeon M11B2D]|nr:MAG: hypothetical protein BV459_00295 [Thermoplasmata archaeon M11B2D]